MLLLYNYNVLLLFYYIITLFQSTQFILFQFYYIILIMTRDILKQKNLYKKIIFLLTKTLRMF